jgi:RNA polymerase sigma-70 factor (ECF subfamily)
VLRGQKQGAIVAQAGGLAEGVRAALQLCGTSRVLGLNDGNAVQTHSTDVIRQDEFATFMRAYQDMVFSTAVRLTGNEAQAEDIAQEVFLRAYENFLQLRESATAGGWLKTVATNLSLNHLTRYRKRWRFFSDLGRDAGDEEETPIDIPVPDTLLDGLDASDRHVVVEKALSELPEHQRVPLVLFHFEEMPYDAIARKLGISLSKVKTDILRGRAALAKRLAEHGVTAVVLES